MGTVSEVLHRLGAQGAGAQSLSVAINARSFFDDVSVPQWGCGTPSLGLFLKGRENSGCPPARVGGGDSCVGGPGQLQGRQMVLSPSPQGGAQARRFSRRPHQGPHGRWVFQNFEFMRTVFPSLGNKGTSPTPVMHLGHLVDRV